MAKKQVRIPKQDRSIDKRERIIVAASDLFVGKGYEKVNTKEIAALAGVSVGTFYSYFADKKSLLIEVIRKYKKQFVDDVLVVISQSGEDHDDLKTLIPVVIRSVLESLRGLPRELFRYALVMRMTDPEIEQLHRLEDNTTLNIILSYEKLFHLDADTEMVTVAARMILMSVKETLNAYILYEPDIPEDLFVKELSAMIFAYLLSKGIDYQQ